jgi:hypothetical protein
VPQALNGSVRVHNAGVMHAITPDPTISAKALSARRVLPSQLLN